MIRLDKYLANMGVGTRAEVKRKISSGQISVDGEIVNRPEYKIDENRQKVQYLGEDIGYEEYEYYMLNKPAGAISATEDKKQKTVLDLIVTKKRKDLFPVGRLDKDTEGLLLITNDGDLAHRLLSPKKHVDKRYYVEVSGIVNHTDIETFKQGVDIGEKALTKEATLEIVSTDAQANISKVYVTIHEGKFHQIKRMFLSIGKEVLYLKRITMGSLVLDESLRVGEYRPLTKEELNDLC